MSWTCHKGIGHEDYRWHIEHCMHGIVIRSGGDDASLLVRLVSDADSKHKPEEGIEGLAESLTVDDHGYVYYVVGLNLLRA